MDTQEMGKQILDRQIHIDEQLNQMNQQISQINTILDKIENRQLNKIKVDEKKKDSVDNLIDFGFETITVAIIVALVLLGIGILGIFIFES
jgi:CRISPR/Cas system CSM-associated protein Csm2 small subunit